LKSKRGERLALKELNDETKEKIKPIINIVDLNDSGKFGFYSTGAFIDLHRNILKGASPENIVFCFTQIHEKSGSNIGMTSVVRHEYSSALLSSLKPFLLNVEKGVAIRIFRADVGNIKSDIDALSACLSIAPEKIDVIIDFDRIDDIAPSLASEFSANINKSLPQYHGNVIILSNAFPEGISVQSNTIGEIPRHEWSLYSAVKKLLPNIIYGDCGADDPLSPAITSRRNIVPTIRYATESCWKIVRGFYDPAKPFDYSQFSDLSRLLIGQDFFMGQEFSWGDRKIYQCATGECGNGNLEFWVRIAMNHHITLAVDQCARL
jgi:hypothetical protein